MKLLRFLLQLLVSLQDLTHGLCAQNLHQRKRLYISGHQALQFGFVLSCGDVLSVLH